MSGREYDDMKELTEVYTDPDCKVVRVIMDYYQEIVLVDEVNDKELRIHVSPAKVWTASLPEGDVLLVKSIKNNEK